MPHERNQRFFAISRHGSNRLTNFSRVQRPQSSLRKCPADPGHKVSCCQFDYFFPSAAGIPSHREWGQFVSSSVVVVNGTTLTTSVTNSSQMQATITTALVSAPGAVSVTVNTPSGNSGNLGCSSGGTSSALVLTIT